MLSGRVLGQSHNDDPGQSLGELFTRLATLSSELVRDEFALAKHEISQKLKSLGVVVLISLTGVLIAQAALLALCAAAAIALATYVGAWKAVLIVGIVLVLLAVLIGSVALGRLKRLNLRPEQTLETLKEDEQWLKELS